MKTNNMRILVMIAPGEFLTPGEYLDRFGRFNWPDGGDIVCGACFGPVSPLCGIYVCNVCGCESD